MNPRNHGFPVRLPGSWRGLGAAKGLCLGKAGCPWAAPSPNKAFQADWKQWVACGTLPAQPLKRLTVIGLSPVNQNNF